MAQQPFTPRKESPEKDLRHADRPEHGSLPPYDSGEPRPGRVGSDHVFPPSMVSPDPDVFDDRGVPMIKLSTEPGTTAKFTISDVITFQQAEDAGQPPPERLKDLPKEAIKKAKLMGIIHVSDEERAALAKEAAAESRTRAVAGSSLHGPGAPVVHPAPGHDAHTESPLHGVGKTAGEAATQAKYDNRGGGEEK
jgi:predicted Rdx family selenoprotein